MNVTKMGLVLLDGLLEAALAPKMTLQQRKTSLRKTVNLLQPVAMTCVRPVKVSLIENTYL